MPRHHKIRNISINCSEIQREKLHECARRDGRSLSNFLLIRGIEWGESHGVEFFGVERDLPTFGPRIARPKIAARVAAKEPQKRKRA